MSGGYLHLRDVLTTRANDYANRISYVAGDAQLTFAELAERAATRATAFSAAGVRPGDRVAVALDVGLELCETFWGLQQLGAVPAILNPGARPGIRERYLRIIDPRAVLTTDHGLQIAGSPRGFDEAGTEAPAFLQPTSGTSGATRIAVISHRSLFAQLDASQVQVGVSDSDAMIAWVPPWHDLGLVRFLIGSVFYGARCHVIYPAILTIPEMLRAIPEHGVTVSGAPDFFYRLAPRLVDPVTTDLSTLRFMTNGGEPARASSIERFEALFGAPHVVAPAYGLAEATLGVTSHPAGEPLHVDEHGHVSCGPALSGVELAAGISADEPDEIRVRGDIVFSGYLDAPDDTAVVLRDGWLHTGDAGYLDAEGRLFVLGRRASLIKRGGAAIAPREIEEAASGADGALTVAAVGVPDSDGDVVTLVVEASRRGRESSHELAARVTRQVAASIGFAPDRVVVVKPRTIPITANGKIRHAHLRAMLVAGEI